MVRKLLAAIAACAVAALCGGTAAQADPEGYHGVPRTFLWNPDHVDIFDTLKYKKKPPYVIGFSNASISNPWRVALLHSIEAEAAKHKAEISKFIITDANDNPTKQIADIQDLMQRKVDLLLISPATAEALDPIAGRAMRSGIPVVMVDRRTNTESNYVTFVTGSDRELGRVTAQWLAETLKGKGSIIMLAGIAGASPAELRIQAAKEVFNQYPDIKVLDLQYTSWSPAQGKQIMAAMIQKYGKQITGVWCDSGLECSGSIQAFVDAGYKDGEIPPQTGGDINAMYQLALRHKVPMAGIDYPPLIGAKAVDVLFDVLAGKPVLKRIEVNQQTVVSKGYETASVKADYYVRDYALMDKPGDTIMSTGLGPSYDPKTFHVDLPQ
jgi:ribose transport system substrate-binding protein